MVLLSGCLTLPLHATEPLIRAPWRLGPTSAEPVAPPALPRGGAESLPSLLARVLPVEPQVRVARSLFEATHERWVQARSRLGPTVGVNVNHGRSKTTEFGAPLDRTTDRTEGSVRWNLYNFDEFLELFGSHSIPAAKKEKYEI